MKFLNYIFLSFTILMSLTANAIVDEKEEMSLPSCSSKDKMISGCYARVYNKNGILKGKYAYKNEELNGYSYEYYENGKLMSKKHYEKGVLHGPSFIYYKSGELKQEGVNFHGKLNGLVFEYFHNKNVKSIIKYNQGVIKNVKIYKQDGVIYASVAFKDGNLYKFESYYPSFALQSTIIDKGEHFDIVLYNLLGEVIYENAVKMENKSLNSFFKLLHKIEDKDLEKKTVKCKELEDKNQDGCIDEIYSQDGVKVQETEYKYNLPNGESINYTKEGKIFSRDHYKDGKLNGSSIYYDKDGNIRIIFIYKDNSIIDAKCMNKKRITSRDIFKFNRVINLDFCYE